MTIVELLAGLNLGQTLFLVGVLAALVIHIIELWKV